MIYTPQTHTRTGKYTDTYSKTETETEAETETEIRNTCTFIIRV